MRSIRTCRNILLPLLLAFAGTGTNAFTVPLSPNPAAEIAIRLDPPTFVIPRFADPFMERESGIAPHEHELAEKLRGLLDSGDKQAALAELNAMMELELSPALVHLKGQVYFALENYKQAEDAFNMALLRVPQFIRAHSDLGQLYLVTDRPEKAREHFAKAVAYGERNPVVYGQLGYLNLKLHSAQSAIAAYQNALAIEPANPQWQQGMLAALSQANLYPAAIAFTQEILTKTPDNADLWLNKAFLHLREDDHFKALASLETALALGNDDPANEMAAAQLHLQLGSYERALALLEDHIKRHPVDLETLNRLTAWLEQGNRWRELSALLATYEQAADIPEAEISQYQLLRARAARGAGDHQAAVRHYRAALDADPANVDALLSAAFHHFSQGNYVEAESLYTRAETFDEARRDALLGRAKVYIEIKDYASALEVLREARSAYPDTPELARNIRILENTLNTQALKNP